MQIYTSGRRTKMKRILAGVLAGTMLLGLLSGCQGQGQPEESQEPETSTTVTGSAQGYGAITADVTVDGSGKIIELVLHGDNETPSIGGEALESLREAILTAGTVEGVDSVSGATLTSEGVFNAVRNALNGETAPGEITYTAGTYEGVGAGRNGDIHVSVTVDETRILSIDVGENQETAGISDIPKERIPDAILANQSLAVDAISGATLTSRGLVAAITDALSKSGVDLAALQAAPVTPPEPMDTTDRSTDVVVLGAGMAGLVAAITAREKGADVILVEKMSFTGGNLLIAGGGLGTVGAETVEENDDLQRTLDYFKLVNETSERQPDYDFLEKFLPETGRAIDYLTNTFGLTHTSTDRGDYIRTNFDGNGAVFTKSLTDLCDSLGVVTLLNTKAEHILTEDGKAIGVQVSNRSGSYTISAQKVIVATGGASRDWDRMVAANPELNTIDFYEEAAVSSTGDGFAMLEEVGAQMDVGPFIKSAYPDISPAFGYTYANSPNQQDTLVINAQGQRVANEAPYNQMFFNKQLLRQASEAYYAIFDQSKMADYFLADAERLAEREDNSIVVKTDSLEELASKIDIPADALQASFDRYQSFCEAGADEDFGKDTSHLLPYEEGTLYAVRVYPASWGTIGGCVSDDTFHVLNTDGAPIDNLFAVGECSTARFFGDYYFGGFSLGYYTAAGMVAAETAVAELTRN